MQMTPTPVVSVIMPVYNCETHVAEAVDSIVGQTFRDFEFIIVDDGSTDASARILAEIAQRDQRIRICTQANAGIGAALNVGCNLASGKYIARMDGDDIALPERFARQVAYLESHPQIGIIGARVERIDGRGAPVSGGYSLPSNAIDIRWALFFGHPPAPFMHPTVMMRHDLLKEVGYYDASCYYEDLELWHRLLAITDGQNVPDILLRYRIHDGQMAANRGQREGEVFEVIAAWMTKYLGVPVSAAIVECLRCEHTDGADLQVVTNIAEAVLRTFAEREALGRSEYVLRRRMIASQLVSIALRRLPEPSAWKMLWRSLCLDHGVLLRKMIARIGFRAGHSSAGQHGGLHLQ